MARKRDYKKEYAARKASAKKRNITLGQATGHAKRAKKKSITDLRIDFRFPTVREFFDNIFNRRKKGRPLPVPGQPDTPESMSPVSVPEGMDVVAIFITSETTIAVYPDGSRRRGSIDQVYQEAKESGFAVVVTSGNPPKVENVRTKSGMIHSIADTVGTKYRTECNRTVAGSLTSDAVTCRICIKRTA